MPLGYPLIEIERMLKIVLRQTEQLAKSIKIMIAIKMPTKKHRVTG